MKLQYLLSWMETVLLFSQTSAISVITDEWFHFFTSNDNGNFSPLNGSSRIRAALNCDKNPDCLFFCKENNGFIQSDSFSMVEDTCEDDSLDTLHCWTNRPYVGAIGDKKEDGLYYRLHMIKRTHAEAIVCCRRKPKWRLAIMRTAATFEVFKDFQRDSGSYRIALKKDLENDGIIWEDGTPLDLSITTPSYTYISGDIYVMYKYNIDDEPADIDRNFLCQANHDGLPWY